MGIGAVFAAAALGMTYSTEETVQPYPVDPDDTPSISALKQDIARTPTGRALLDFAVQHKIKVVEDDSIVDRGVYNHSQRTLKLQMSIPTEDKVNVFAHELRHAWQNINLGYAQMGKKFLLPREDWALSQHVEADAFAFSWKLSAERMTLLRQRPAPLTLLEDIGDKSAILAEKSRTWHGLSDQDYYQYAVRPAFQHVGSYQEKHLEDISRATIYYLDCAGYFEAVVEKGVYSEGDMQRVKAEKIEADRIFLSGPEASKFSTWLRGFGGQSLASDQKTTLSDLPAEVILNELPDLFTTKDEKRQLDTELETDGILRERAARQYEKAVAKVNMILKKK